MSEAKERPILFSGPMVRAILEGRKTVTRRAAKNVVEASYFRSGWEATQPKGSGSIDITSDAAQLGKACPYGRPGDRLWVREAWLADAQLDSIVPRNLSQGEPIMYPADGSVRQTGCAMVSQGRGRPSIHMPRWASRILLEITDVRVERLQDISEQQAIAEGIVGVPFRPDDGWPICTGYMADPDDGKTPLETHASKAFAGLWRSINGPESWDANPWVWAIEFKRIQQ
ncbi:hypothetical protein ACIPZF_22265 [Pseudomonas sp. NPDC089752]|uniref:hypothetical protein n=1 Tax=Pseudomonas sp. NPDC089752 TaxID=3364472 RepID=UPI003830B2DB